MYYVRGFNMATNRPGPFESRCWWKMSVLTMLTITAICQPINHTSPWTTKKQFMVLYSLLTHPDLQYNIINRFVSCIRIIDLVELMKGKGSQIFGSRYKSSLGPCCIHLEVPGFSKSKWDWSFNYITLKMLIIINNLK